jgi:hypothetical protein
MNLTKIPRNIFQTWYTKNISDQFRELTQTWINNNLNYAYFLFDDNDCELFIKKNFEIQVYNAYCRIIPGAFKADLWRYCILYIYGGVYVDIDTICINTIDDYLNNDIEFMTPIDLNNCPHYGKYNLFNSFIASIPKHPILLDCINRIVHNVENNIVPFSNLDFSGPGVLGKSTNLFLKLDENTSFIGKEGIINKIKFLKFEYKTEYIKDLESNKILLQNKNGNPSIQEIYNNEAKQNNVDWGSCKNPIRPIDLTIEPTIVSMFYNIREKENNTSNSSLNHSITKYIEFAKDFLLKLPYNLIIFTDDDELIDVITEERHLYMNKTYIYNKKFEETYYFRHVDKLKILQTKYNIINGHLDHETPMYIIVTNNKFDFIQSAIELNPFKSNHFIWMDFGINHVALNTEKISEWIFNTPDKIKQLCINPYIEYIDNKQMFKYIYHHMAGGLFSGSSKNLLEYCKLFKKKTEQIYSEEWYQLEEAVMTMIQRENPDLFDLYYGDYQGIISNYLTPIHNIKLILKGSQKCIDLNKPKQAYNILCYCNKYFEENPNDELAYQFIQQHIIVDYYNNNCMIVHSVINLINLLKTINYEKIDLFLKSNTDNIINFYINKEAICPRMQQKKD